MAVDEIHIDKLSLSVSGLSEREGRRLAELVADGLAVADLPALAAGAPHALRVRLDAGGAGVEALSERVIAAIVRQLSATA